MASNYNDTTPAAPSNRTNAQWQTDGSGNVSANVPTAAQELVASNVDLTAQAANVASTPILTPGANQMYRISALILVSQAATTSSTLPSIVISWTDFDSNTAQSFTLTPTNTGNNLTTFQQALMVLKAKSGVAINVSTAGYASTGATPMQFALHLRIEAI